jgi:hypothetical protein
VFLPSAAPGAYKICFKPGMVLNRTEFTLEHKSEKESDKLYYDADAFLPLLKYDHVNKAAIDEKLRLLHEMLEKGSPEKCR